MDSQENAPKPDPRDKLDYLEYAYLPPGSNEPVPCDRATFQRWWDKQPDWYWKKQDTVGPFDVATRFIGIDPHFSAPPLWWEVSIQESFRSCSHRYFATLEQALKRHSELVTSLEAGVLEEV